MLVKNDFFCDWLQKYWKTLKFILELSWARLSVNGQSCKQGVLSLLGGEKYPPELDKEALEGVILSNNDIWGRDPHKTFKLRKPKTNPKSLLKDWYWSWLGCYSSANQGQDWVLPKSRKQLQWDRLIFALAKFAFSCGQQKCSKLINAMVRNSLKKKSFQGTWRTWLSDGAWCSAWLRIFTRLWVHVKLFRSNDASALSTEKQRTMNGNFRLKTPTVTSLWFPYAHASH